MQVLLIGIYTGLICTIEGTTITAGTETQLNNLSRAAYQVSAVKLIGNKIFTAYGYRYMVSSNTEYASRQRLYGIITELQSINKITDGSDKIAGVANTAGTAGQIIQVIEPDV